MNPGRYRQLMEECVHTGMYPEQYIIDSLTDDPEGRITRGVKIVSNNMEKAVEVLDAGTKLILEANDRLSAAEAKAVSSSKVSISRVKDMSQQLSQQLVKVNQILGKDYTERLDQLERMVDALTKLNDLNSAGKLDKLMAALGSK